MTLDDGKRAALLAQAYEFAIGEEVAVIPMLFPITTWAMRKGITYGGFPQEATVASLVHVGKVMSADVQALCDAVDGDALMRHVHMLRAMGETVRHPPARRTACVISRANSMRWAFARAY